MSEFKSYYNYKQRFSTDLADLASKQPELSASLNFSVSIVLPQLGSGVDYLRPKLQAVISNLIKKQNRNGRIQ